METDQICITQNEYVGILLTTSTQSCSQPIVTKISWLIDIATIIIIAFAIIQFIRKKYI